MIFIGSIGDATNTDDLGELLTVISMLSIQDTMIGSTLILTKGTAKNESLHSTKQTVCPSMLNHMISPVGSMDRGLKIPFGG